MSNYTNSLNELINTKKELKDIIIESGQTPGEVFSYYPNMIRNAIAAGGGSLVDYPTYTYVATYYPDFTYLFSYVGDALSGIDVDVDLSSYVTKDELSAQSYVTSTVLENASYVTSTALENASYVTYSYVDEHYMKTYDDIYSPSAQIGNLWVLGALTANANTYSYNVIPQENNTYTLGDSSYMYSTAYVTNLKLNSTGAHSISFNGSDIRLAYNDVGFYLNNTGFRPESNGNKLLGTSSNYWGATYTYNLYADTIHNFIWTGTSAEYALLDNYTTYQLYLIQEA